MHYKPMQNCFASIIAITDHALEHFQPAFLEIVASGLFSCSPRQNTACFGVNKGQNVDSVLSSL
jgi:hypothetical protein